MAKVLALAAARPLSDFAERLRSVLVFGCALALILADRAVLSILQ